LLDQENISLIGSKPIQRKIFYRVLQLQIKNIESELDLEVRMYIYAMKKANTNINI